MLAWVLVGAATANGRAANTQSDGRISTQDVHLAESVPVPCVAVAAERGVAMIVFSREELDRLAAVSSWRGAGEPARLALIAGSRARLLLKQLGPAHDARGCQSVQGVVPFDARFLVGQLLEKGHATVFTRRSNLPEPTLQVRHVSTLLDGRDEFVLLDGTEIWSYGTWHAG